MQANALAAQQSIASMQDATNRYGMNNQYQLGLGGLGLQDKSLDNNFYTTNRGLDLSQYSLGANLMNQGNLGLTNQGTQLYQSGLTQQQQPWATLGQYAGTLSPFTGLNQSQSQTTPGPSTLQNLLAGGLTGAQIWQLLLREGLSNGKPTGNESRRSTHHGRHVGSPRAARRARWVARHLEWSPGLRRRHASGQAAAGSGRTPQAPARPTCLAT